MTNRNMIEAINDAHRVMMAADDSIIVYGEDVGFFGGVFRATEGLQKQFGKTRAFDAPISEGGIIGNGAGLVMSTLDVVAYAGENHGGVKPANFLDIGGGASAEVMAAGLDVILGDPQVKAVFVNVFGGITACDAVAKGIVGALAELGRAANKPLVVRLDGNNVEEGHRILTEAAHPLVTVVDTMDGAADKAAELAHTSKGT